jgi:hydrogenase expression/formation protein HypE
MSITTVRLSHGSGKGNKELLETVILPALMPRGFGVLEDAFIFDIPGRRLAFTTDSFVVSPLEFPGGNIGKLAACGTINDLAMMGAQPVLLSVALILEEGLDCALLAKMLRSLSVVCTSQGARIACGDTKVVDKGKADGMFITTSGIGIVKAFPLPQPMPGPVTSLS